MIVKYPIHATLVLNVAACYRPTHVMTLKHLGKTLQVIASWKLLFWNNSLWGHSAPYNNTCLPMTGGDGAAQGCLKSLLFVNADSKEINKVLGRRTGFLQRNVSYNENRGRQLHKHDQCDWFLRTPSEPFSMSMFFGNNLQITHTAVLTGYWSTRTSSFHEPLGNWLWWAFGKV